MEQVIFLVFDKPIESRAMVDVKSLLTCFERIKKIDLLNISKDFLVVFGYRDIINVFFQGFEGGF